MIWSHGLWPGVETSKQASPWSLGCLRQATRAPGTSSEGQEGGWGVCGDPALVISAVRIRTQRSARGWPAPASDVQGAACRRSAAPCRAPSPVIFSGASVRDGSVIFSGVSEGVSHVCLCCCGNAWFPSPPRVGTGPSPVSQVVMEKHGWRGGHPGWPVPCRGRGVAGRRVGDKA